MRESEVGNGDLTVLVDQDIGGRQITVNQAGRVDGFESIADLHNKRFNLLDRCMRDALKRLCVDPFAQDVRAAMRRFSVAVVTNHAWMVDL